MSSIICFCCPHHCHIPEGKTGLCRARKNEGGNNVSANYGRITSLALDPIEKKPLVHFYPGTMIVSCGSYGCNLACPFCQNSTISMADEHHVQWQYISPEEMAAIVMKEDSIGLAFTYNEPLISFEYILDCAKLLKPQGKKIVIVTNGMIDKEVMQQLLPYVDAMNIDLKGDEMFYKEELHGSYEVVRENIALCAKACHVEVTTLVIPGKNDDPTWIEEQAQFLSSINPNIVYHLTRYFPRYKYEIPPTDKELLLSLKDAAQKHLRYVELGNIF